MHNARINKHYSIHKVKQFAKLRKMHPFNNHEYGYGSSSP